MYNAQDSINTAYNYIQASRAKGYKYSGVPVYDVSKSDLEELKKLGDKYGIPFEWLINLIRHESAATFNPAITNSIGATGLIQFLSSTAQALGTTTDALRKMTFKQQLVYVDKYLSMQLRHHLIGGKIPNNFTQGDVFMTIFYPVAIGKPDYQFSQKVTNSNPGIATPKDYVEKALKYSVFPLSLAPYTLEDFKKQMGGAVAYAKKHPLPLILGFVGLVGAVIAVVQLSKTS